MAKYGFIYTDITPEAALDVLGQAACALFGNRLAVRATDGGFLVSAPGTGSDDPREAMRLWLATGEDATMLVEHDPTWMDRPCLAFRDDPSPKWWRWASGCVREEVSDRLGLPIVYDATALSVGPGDRHYRRGRTFRAYMTACFGGPLTKPRERFLRPHFAIAPLAFVGPAMAHVLAAYERARGGDRSQAPTPERLREEMGRLSWTGGEP